MTCGTFVSFTTFEYLQLESVALNPKTGLISLMEFLLCEYFPYVGRIQSHSGIFRRKLSTESRPGIHAVARALGGQPLFGIHQNRPKNDNHVK